MPNPRHIRISDYDYPLPPGQIATHPLPERDSSRLLIYKNGLITEDVFANLAGHLPEKSLLVFNETKVIHARLLFQKPSGSTIEVFLLEPVLPTADVQSALQERQSVIWKCFVGNAKRWKTETLPLLLEIDATPLELQAQKVEQQNETFLIRFSWANPSFTFAQVLDVCGKIPLPPYIRRKAEIADEFSYQTVYAQHQGSVAAPTAGLHFTKTVFRTLENKKIQLGRVTLHVGAGTFKPVSSEQIGDHAMHAEQIVISRDLIQKIYDFQDPVIAVGTTTVRTLESIYWQGVKWLNQNQVTAPQLHIEQWDAYEMPQDVPLKSSLQRVLQVLEENKLDALRGETALMIAPGYRYRIPHILITNFHQPKSTLLLLVSAFIGNDWRKCYDYALQHDFRFLSYGDACLFFATHNPEI